MARQRPEPGVEHAAEPNAEYRAHRSSEAARSLARFLGVTRYRARELLDDEAALGTAIEIRSAYLAARKDLRQRHGVS